MKVLIALVLTAFAVACAEEVNPSELTAFDYHNKFGVPQAELIQQAEEQLVQNRIVGGWNAVSGAHPHQAGLVITLTSNQVSVCGASLLSNTRVVTAAHCWFDGWNQGRQFVVVLGSLTLFTGGTRITTSAVTMHGSWNPSIIANDVAIVVIAHVNYSTLIQPIALPSGTELNNNFAGVWGVASGWGAQNSAQAATGIPGTQVKHQVNLQIITNAVCQNTYGSIVQASNICTSGAGGVGTCGGDSGGPLTVVSNNRRILAGITSFGASAGCAIGLPAAFARATSYAAWLQQRM